MTTSPAAPVETQAGDFPPELALGVRLDHLADLSRHSFITFDLVADLIDDKLCERSSSALRSYAHSLALSPTSKHLVKSPADVVVSYSRSQNYVQTLTCLQQYFGQDSLDKTFVWMDFASCDVQRLKAYDVEEWHRLFSALVSIVGKGIQILSPVHKPTAFTSVTCYFEIATFLQTSATFCFCSLKDDFDLLIEKLLNKDVAGSEVDKILEQIDIFRVIPETRMETSLLELLLGVGEQVNAAIRWEFQNYLAIELSQILSEPKQRYLSKQPGDSGKVALHQICGMIFEQMNSWDQSIAEYQKALAISKRIHGSGPTETAVLMNKLAGLLAEKGDLDEAEQLYREALEIQKKREDWRVFSIVTEMNNLALILKKKGRLDEAAEQFEEAMELADLICRPDDPRLVTLLSNFGKLKQLLGEFDIAEHLLTRAVDISRWSDCDPNLSTADGLIDLALLFEEQRRFDEAEIAAQEAVSIYSTAPTETDQTELASALHVHAVILHGMDQDSRAQATCLKAVETLLEDCATCDDTHHGRGFQISRTSPQETPTRGTGLDEWPSPCSVLIEPQIPTNPNEIEVAHGHGQQAGGLATTMEEITAAAQHTRGVATIADKRPNIPSSVFHGHPGIAYMPTDRQVLLADILVTLGEVEESLLEFQSAYSHLHAAYELYKVALGLTHLKVANTLLVLGRVSHQQKDMQEAERVVREALDIGEVLPFTDYFDLDGAMELLASILHQSGHLNEAERLYRRSLALEMVADVKRDEVLASRMSNLGSVLADSGQYDEAIELYRNALRLTVSEYGRLSVKSLTRILNLASVLEDAHLLEEAEILHREAVDLAEGMFGRHHLETALCLDRLARNLHLMRELEDARDVGVECYEIRLKLLGPDHPLTREAETWAVSFDC